MLDSALTPIQKVLMIHMAGSSTSVLHAFSTHPYGRMVMEKKLLNVAYATLFPSSLKSSKEKVAQSSQTLKVAQSSQTFSYSIGRVVAGPKLGRYEPKTAVFKLTQVSPKLSRRQSWAQLCFTFHLAMCEGLCSAGFSTYPNSESFDDPYGRIEHICASCILNTSIWQDGYGKETFECSICYFVSLIIEIFHVSLLTA